MVSIESEFIFLVVGGPMASQIKLSVVLPIAQVTVTGTFTYWADRVDWIIFGEHGRVAVRFPQFDISVIYLRQIWRGVNAPALPFSFAGYDATHLRLVGFGLGEIMYFAVVAVVWWLAGRYLDRRRAGITPERQGARSILFAILGLVWGMLLLAFAIFSIQDFVRLTSLFFLLHSRGYFLLTQLLFLVWSLILMAVNVPTLMRRIRRKFVKRGTPA